MMERVFSNDIMKEIQERWSPRAFDRAHPVPDEELEAVLEAAHFAPSCMNEQPWLFLVGSDPGIRMRLLNVLSEKNQTWAQHAPVLLLLLAKKNFSGKDRLNRWNQFDLGTAWGFLSLEAQRRGLQTHAMGGFDAVKARSEFEIPDDIDIVAAVALGYAGNKDLLPPDLQETERPNGRKPLQEALYPVR